MIPVIYFVTKLTYEDKILKRDFFRTVNLIKKPIVHEIYFDVRMKICKLSRYKNKLTNLMRFLPLVYHNALYIK